MTELERIAPRLAAAHRAERIYQERLRIARQTGWLPAELAIEEMRRSLIDFIGLYRQAAADLPRQMGAVAETLRRVGGRR